MLATLTMRPKRAAIISSATSRAHRNAPVRLVARIRSQIVKLVRLKGADSAIPELLTNISIAPFSFRQARKAVAT